MNIKKLFSAFIAAAILSTIPMTGMLPEPLGLTANAVEYDEYGLNISNNRLLSVSPDVTDVEIPDGVKYISADAFSRCKKLGYIYIPASVISISADFTSCSKLEYIFVDPGNEKYSSDGGVLFNKDGTELIYYPMAIEESIYYIPYGVEKIRANAFYNCKNLTDVVISDSVKTVNGFTNCTYLKNITISESVTAINSDAFLGCKSIINIEVASDNTKFSSVDGVLFNKDKTKLIQYTVGKSDVSYTIPKSVTEIGDNAFSGCYELESIGLPGGLQIIGDSAFSDCAGLRSLPLPGGVTAIGNNAFSGCTLIKSVDFPNDMRTIGSGAFSKCIDLSSVTFSEGITEIGDNAFTGCRSLKSVTIPGDPKLGESVFEKGTAICGKKGSGVEKYVQDNRASLNYTFSALASALKGDVNNDDIVNINDVLSMLNHIVGNTMLTGSALENAELNDDGKIDVLDVILVLEICVS